MSLLINLKVVIKKQPTITVTANHTICRKKLSLFEIGLGTKTGTGTGTEKDR
jgi:hypothetical protein